MVSLRVDALYGQTGLAAVDARSQVKCLYVGIRDRAVHRRGLQHLLASLDL
jgi:hypothetical protein